MIPKNEAIKKGVTIIDSKQSRNALVETLKANFPQVIKDNQVDLQAIATLLGLNDKADIQGYELTFTGKGLANALYSTPTQKLLTFETSFIPPHSTESVITRQSQSDNEAIQNIESTCHTEPLGEVSKSLESSPQTPQNFIIRGDNLDALKILKSAYTEKIKMIYIDPPYNTKNENFIYPDNFRKDYQAILQEVGLLEIDENGEEKESETLKFFRNIQGSRTHSGWLAFMLPRLKLARDLLKDDGVIFISIDDNEQANLKILCDEIFGEENFVEVLHWKRKKQPSFLSKHTAGVMEYILVYAKQSNNLEKLSLETLSDATKKVMNLTNTTSVRFFKKGMRVKLEGSGIIKKGVYQIKTMSLEYLDDVIYENGITKNDIKIKAQFSVSQDKIDKYISENLIFITTNYSLRRNVSQEEQQKKKSITNLLLDWGDNQDSDKEIIEIFNGKVFDNPKPIMLIKKLLKATTTPSTSAGGGGTLAA